MEGIEGLEGFTVEELLGEVTRRRETRMEELHNEREELQERLRKIDAEMSSLKITGQLEPKRVTEATPRCTKRHNDGDTLEDRINKVLPTDPGETFSVQEAVTFVLESGFQANASNPAASVVAALTRSDQFLRVGYGVYSRAPQEQVA